MINTALFITSFLFVASCLLSDHLRYKYQKYFSIPKRKLSGRAKNWTIMVSLINLSLSGFAIKAIYPFCHPPDLYQFCLVISS